VRTPYPVIQIFGPTAVGKTGLLSRLLPGKTEIISADSMQVYRYMDIGTAKPSFEERAKTRYHLIDILNPDEQYNTGMFVHLTDRLIPQIIERNRVPIVSGGTAFYFINLMYGLPETPPGDPVVRDGLRKECKERGLKALFHELAEKDPVSAERIGENDSYRIIRALEVVRQTGRPLSRFSAGRKIRKRYRFFTIGLQRKREELYRRIELRADEMIQAGLKDEIVRLLGRGYSAADPGMRGIGYREFMQMRWNGCLTFGDVAEKIKQSSRRYAKRQITFFKRLPDIHWFNPEDCESIENAVIPFLADKEFDIYRKVL